MIREINSQTKILAANKCLQSFAPETHLEKRKSGIYVCWKDHNNRKYVRLWKTNGRQDFYPLWFDKWPHGGTAVTALAQLIRWIDCLPIFPIASWQYWASDECLLLKHEAVDELLSSGYPENVSCVLCNQQIDGYLDWWSNKKFRSGPCCGWSSGCKQKGLKSLDEKETIK